MSTVSMRKTLLLVFIHGFKGGDDTFGTFPEHIRALLSHALPKVNVLAIQYPKFETRGELSECVVRLREWLENKVIDLEVANSTPSPTIDPSVHTILIGHSMGGIVAAETLLLLANERPIRRPSSAPNQEEPDFPSNTTLSSATSTSHPNLAYPNEPPSPIFLFPHVQAVMAFDTPYLGLAPEMVAHGLEGGTKAASSAWETANELAGIFGYGSKGATGSTDAAAAASKATKPRAALPAPVADASVDAAATPRWQSWGKYAMFAGAAGAVAAGGAAALYSQREKLSAGWGWATSHLLFVGDLAKAENLRKRVERMEQVVAERGLGGCANFYTNLGRGAREGYGITEQYAGRERTFCNLPVVVKEKALTNNNNNTVDGPRERGKLRWMRAINDKAKDETSAHMSMFFPRDNPNFYNLGERAVETLASWIDEGWYASSDGPDTAVPADFDHNRGEKHAFGSLGKDWEGLNRQDAHDADSEDVAMKEQNKEDKDELEDSVLIENMRSSAGNLNSSDSLGQTEPEAATKPKEPLVDLSDHNPWSG